MSDSDEVVAAQLAELAPVEHAVLLAGLEHCKSCRTCGASVEPRGRIVAEPLTGGFCVFALCGSCRDLADRGHIGALGET